MTQKFRRMVRRVGKSFYSQHISDVREAVRSRTLTRLIQRVSSTGEIRTQKYRIRAMASAVRGGYDCELAGGGRNAAKAKNHTGFWIEVYWPVKPGERNGTDKSLNLFFHEQKVKANGKIRKGDRVLFYETEEHPDQTWLGARTIFACGEVSGDTGVAISPKSYSGKRWWVLKRPVHIEKSVPPVKGVPFESIRKILGWGPRAKLRRGPMSISELQFNKIADMLGHSRIADRAHHGKSGRGGHPRQPDIQKRLEIERRAVEFAFKWYEERGYKVESVEKENVGWDLEARSTGHTILVEVKGLSGGTVSIGLTPNEYRMMSKPSKRAQYRIFVVANALGKMPRPYEFFYSGNPPCWGNVEGRELKIQEIVSANLTME